MNKRANVALVALIVFATFSMGQNTYAKICKIAPEKVLQDKCEVVKTHSCVPVVSNPNVASNTLVVTNDVKNTNEKGVSKVVANSWKWHELTPSQDKNVEHLISALHKQRKVNFTTGENPLSEVVIIYDSNDKKTSKRLTVKDKYNNFAEDVFYYNFIKYGVTATSPIAEIPILSYIKNQGGIPISQVNSYLGLDNHEFSVYFSTILGEDVSLGAYIAAKKELALNNVEYKNYEELNESVTKDFGALDNIFEGDEEKLQGFSYVDANLYFNEEFANVKGRYKFFNKDNSYSNCEYIEGIVKGIISDDGKAFKIIAGDLVIEISKDLTKNCATYDYNSVKTMKVVLPVIKIKNATRLENFSIFADERKINILNDPNFGRFYFITSFEISKEGVFFGEHPQKQKKESLLDKKKQEVLGAPQIGLTVDTSFKMKVFYKDIELFTGIIDGSKSFEF